MIEIIFNEFTKLDMDLYDDKWEIFIRDFGVEFKEKHSNEVHCYPWSSIASIKKY